MHCPLDYPSSSAPHPVILADMSEARRTALTAELVSLYAGDVVGFAWAEHLRQALLPAPDGDAAADDEPPAGDPTAVVEPDSAQYGQRMRHFDGAACDPAHAVEVSSGAPFHPPKGGPGESFQAHVARVERMESVQWVLSTLLQDRRIARATHNSAQRESSPRSSRAANHTLGKHLSAGGAPSLAVVAYRFWDKARGVQVADNDDDGESSSGQKLAGLLELMGANDVIVVVSRWYGGVHLGPARFKYIASAAQRQLSECGIGAERGRGAGGVATTSGPRSNKGRR